MELDDAQKQRIVDLHNQIFLTLVQTVSGDSSLAMTDENRWTSLASNTQTIEGIVVAHLALTMACLRLQRIALALGMNQEEIIALTETALAMDEAAEQSSPTVFRRSKERKN